MIYNIFIHHKREYSVQFEYPHDIHYNKRLSFTVILAIRNNNCSVINQKIYIKNNRWTNTRPGIWGHIKQVEWTIEVRNRALQRLFGLWIIHGIRGLIIGNLRKYAGLDWYYMEVLARFTILRWMYYRITDSRVA